MKLQLLHGPAINSSRKKLLEIRSKFDSASQVVFEKGSDPQEVLVSLQSQPLFADEQIIIWENPPDDFQNYKLPPINCQLILWFDYEIDPKDYPNTEIFFFPEEKEASIFPLLDALGARDKKAYLELEKRNRTSPDDTQYILTMVFYLLRSLVVTPKQASDFVRRKNEKMRAKFSKIELIDLYKSILEIDFKIKSGLLEIPQAEFSLVNLFAH